MIAPPLAAAVQLVRDGVLARQSHDGQWMVDHVRRVFTSMTSRGDRERLVAHLALLAAEMAERVPADEREAVLAELEAAATPEGAALAELVRLGVR